MTAFTGSTLHNEAQRRRARTPLIVLCASAPPVKVHVHQYSRRHRDFRIPHDLQKYLLQVRLLDRELDDRDVLGAQRGEQLLDLAVRFEADVEDAATLA